MKIFALLACVGSICASAQAVDIRIDLSTSQGTTSGNWNNISNLNGLTSDLIDYSTGLSTGASISGAGWSDFFGDDGGAFGNLDWVEQPCTVDGAGIQSDSTGTFTFGGLNSASAYRLEVLSIRNDFNYLNTLTVDGVGADRTFNGSAVVNPWNSTTDGLGARNWLIWSNIVATNGTFTLTNVTTSTLGIVNAVRIVEVPSPAPVACLAFGAAIFAAPRRRR